MTLSLTLKRRDTSEPYSLPTASGLLHATPEQASIITAAVTTKSNLIINALAGAAKTSTLEFITRYLPGTPILCLAFNKRIAEEMTKRFPPNVTCRTMNSLGHRVWGTAIGKRLAIDSKKSYTLLTESVKALGPSDRSDAYSDFADTLKTIAFAKRAGYVPDGFPTARPILTPEEFYECLEEAPSALTISLVDEVLAKSIRLSYAGAVDFDDQIYMPTLFGGSFPSYPLVMVDEAQDLSEINHAMLRKVAKSRLIAVGDPYQSIYGFRGAKFGGMASIEREFSCTPLPLSVSFRCPQAIVEFVRSRVPHMQWRKPGGHVESLDRLGCADIPDGAAFICRNNAPLFELALRLLAAGRGVNVVGSDLGPALIKVMKKLGPETLTQEESYAAIETWKAERLAKARNPAPVEDRAECLRVFVRFGATLGGAIAYAEHLFSRKGTIQLLSGHKAKGLEWETVYHLDPWRIPSPWARSEDEKEQEANIAYVISTRAKSHLFEIDLDKINFEEC